MRQSLTVQDEAHLAVRTLAVDYVSGAVEPIHTHRWPQLLYAARGAVTVNVPKAYWILASGQALWIPSGVPHQLKMSSSVALRTLYFCDDLLVARQGPVGLRVSPLLHESIVRACLEGHLDERSPFHAALVAVIRHELVRAPPESWQLLYPVDRRALRLSERFLAADAVDVPLEQLIAEASLSRRTAERVFRRETGLSPARWRRQAVMARSLIAIANGDPIEVVARQSGYASRTAFHAAFRTIFGFPPGELLRG
ncbi:MAG: AraC family transcriptional regulator [Pseudohaliea sp.]